MEPKLRFQNLPITFFIHNILTTTYMSLDVILPQLIVIFFFQRFITARSSLFSQILIPTTNRVFLYIVRFIFQTNIPTQVTNNAVSSYIKFIHKINFVFINIRSLKRCCLYDFDITRIQQT